MFKIDPDSGYWRTVHYYVYSDMHGEFTGFPLEVKFRYLKRSQAKAMWDEIKEPDSKLTDEDICRQLVLEMKDGDQPVSLGEAFEIQDLIEIISKEYFNSVRELREKKLTDAASYWLSGGGAVDKQDLDTFGKPADLGGEDTPGDFFVWPQNWDAVRVFISSQTQKRVTPMGQVCGLDYHAVALVMGWLNVQDQSEAFEGIQVMEIEMLRQSLKKNA
jgi:hypothetical protein